MKQEQIKAEIHKIVDFGIENKLRVAVNKGQDIITYFHDGWKLYKVMSLTEPDTWNFDKIDYTPLDRHIETVKQIINDE